MAVLLSTQSSAVSTLAPAIHSLLHHHHHHDSPSTLAPASASASDSYRNLIHEHLDCSVALLDVCKSLQEATCELEHHLGRLDHTLSHAASTCRSTTTSSTTAMAQLQAAGRRLATCLPAPENAARRRSSSRPALVTWQQRLADAHVSLRSLKKSLKSMQPLQSAHPDPAFAAALQALNGTTVTTALLLSAVTSSLMSLCSSGASGLRSNSWRNMSAASRRRRRACILSRSVVDHLNAGAKNPWASPLGKLQQDLAAQEVEEVGKARSGGTQLDQLYVLAHITAALLMQRQSKAHSGSMLGLMKLGVGNVVKEVREMRSSIAGLQSQSRSLSQALAAVRVALLNAL